MYDDKKILILCIIGICIIASMMTWVIIDIVIDNKHKKTVLEKSDKIKSLIKLNESIYFEDNIKPIYLYHFTCNSKRQLDRLSIDEYFITLIDSGERFYHNIIKTISYNTKTYDDYIKRACCIESNATEQFCQSIGFSLKKFQKYEERIFVNEVLRKPQVDVSIICKATYTSPQGINHYIKEKTYNYKDLQKFFELTLSLKAKKQTSQYQIKLERAKMTNSLRYDILKRDNFRCQICGFSAKDGVKLHVDHIIPVSKGGKTTPSNLRTLCDRCNIGKSNKV